MTTPRVISIPEKLKPTIRRLTRRAQWSDDRIAFLNSRTLFHVEEAIREVEARLWFMIEKATPSTTDYKNRMIQTDSLRIVEMGEDGEPTGRSEEIPELIRGEVVELLDEIDIATHSTRFIGRVAIGIHEETDRAIAEINYLLRTNVPECAEGEWAIDPEKMVAIETLHAVEEDHQTTEESSSEN